MKKELMAMAAIMFVSGVTHALDLGGVTANGVAKMEQGAQPSPEPVAATAGTELSEDTLQGIYTVQSKDMLMDAKLTLAEGKATLSGGNAGGVWQGSYKFDKSGLILSVESSGGGSLSYTVYFAGQTIESLKAGATVLISLKMDGDSMPAIPFTVKKVE